MAPYKAEVALQVLLQVLLCCHRSTIQTIEFSHLRKREVFNNQPRSDVEGRLVLIGD